MANNLHAEQAVKSYSAIIEEYKRQVEDLNAALADQATTSAHLHEQLSQRDQDIAALRKHIMEMEGDKVEGCCPEPDEECCEDDEVTDVVVIEVTDGMFVSIWVDK